MRRVLYLISTPRRPFGTRSSAHGIRQTRERARRSATGVQRPTVRPVCAGAADPDGRRAGRRRPGRRAWPLARRGWSGLNMGSSMLPPGPAFETTKRRKRKTSRGDPAAGPHRTAAARGARDRGPDARRPATARAAGAGPGATRHRTVDHARVRTRPRGANPAPRISVMKMILDDQRPSPHCAPRTCSHL